MNDLTKNYDKSILESKPKGPSMPIDTSVIYDSNGRKIIVNQRDVKKFLENGCTETMSGKDDNNDNNNGKPYDMTVEDFNEYTVNELKILCDDGGIDCKSGWNKSDIINALIESKYEIPIED